ncbi:TolC family protein [Acinetobacter qingfengensis]|uniref:Transporter n=1 Tax=Acinetobacter qingfengensis TaxID=1262585 RepID=A0A1E7R175_9GAMM|nr:TolC family protein [Acinetobacter qingfengensis]KAA8733317.1 TolC family protein [Acinetobacter qingfengensis]OEY93055.1 transporter [Acinetobacter qingfengensis]
MSKQKQLYANSSAFLKIISSYLISLTVCYSSQTYAEGISYIQAEDYLLQHSYAGQASQALQQAAQLEADSLDKLGLPRVDLNARAYAFHNEVDIPLNTFKQGLESALNQQLGTTLNDLSNIGIPSDVVDQISSTAGSAISNGVNQIPNNATLTLEDQVFRPTVSVIMPIYTGGLISKAKSATHINAERSILSTQQQQDTDRFELIQSYFNVQLLQQLYQSSLENADAMQKHLDNALKLEQQGFISKGQRMQFEVARNNALRLLQTTQSKLQGSQFQLQNLLQQTNLPALTTPLFINLQTQLQLDQLLNSFPQQSTLIQKLQADTQLADAKVNAQKAAQRPKVFAFGEYALDHKQNWVVGVVASYNLFSGIDSKKQIQSAEMQRRAAELITEKSKQELSNLIFKAYNEMNDAQHSHQLIKQNIQAAQENLRIQNLSFKEDMGTATQVIDAENALNQLKSDMALNAYKYVISLATLLQSHGSIDEFRQFIDQPQTDLVRTP